MTYERSNVIPMFSKKHKPAMTVVPNPAYAVSKIELIFKQKAKPEDRPIVKSSGDAYDVFKAAWDDDKMDLLEDFKVMYLNRANMVLSLFDLSRGGITGTVADPRHVIIAALEQNASYMVLAHNHPSGSLRPSQADETITQKFCNAARSLDLKVIDHLIMSRNGFYSFADEGLSL